jgi:hypothetical protein
MDARFELFVDNIERSMAFYRDVLKFEEEPNYGNYHLSPVIRSVFCTCGQYMGLLVT